MYNLFDGVIYVMNRNRMLLVGIDTEVSHLGIKIATIPQMRYIVI